MHTALANHASSGQTGWVCGWVAMSGQGAWTAACTNKKRGELAELEGREAAQRCLLVHAGSCCWTGPTDLTAFGYSTWKRFQFSELTEQGAGWKLSQGKLESGMESDIQRGAEGMHLFRGQGYPTAHLLQTNNGVAHNSGSDGLKTNKPGVNTSWWGEQELVHNLSITSTNKGKKRVQNGC